MQLNGKYLGPKSGNYEGNDYFQIKVKDADGNKTIVKPFRDDEEEITDMQGLKEWAARQVVGSQVSLTVYQDRFGTVRFLKDNKVEKAA